MKRALAILFINLLVPLIVLANNFNLNHGYVENKNFYISLPFETKTNMLNFAPARS